MEHLVSHVRHELVKVLHGFIYVHLASPFASLNMSASCRPMSCAERRKLGTLGRRARRYTD